MAYFDREKETELITDASPNGLSAVLMQNSPNSDDKKVVTYASWTLTPVERRYLQTEREALAMVWAVENLHVYLCGSHFQACNQLQTCPTNSLQSKIKPPARIEH